MRKVFLFNAVSILVMFGLLGVIWLLVMFPIVLLIILGGVVVFYDLYGCNELFWSW
jgi:hypothetical protein